MNLADFLKQYVEEYLFEDLDTMGRSGPPAPAAPGHLGYPMLLTCAAGLEMLGRLAVAPNDTVGNNLRCFERYWERYLYKSEPQKTVGAAVYDLARNGITHNVAAKPRLEIVKSALQIPTGGAREHLTTDPATGVTRIDVTQLNVDLRDSYWGRFKPIAEGKQVGANGETNGTMQKCLDDVLNNNANALKRYAGTLANLPPPPRPSPQAPQSPSTPAPSPPAMSRFPT